MSTSTSFLHLISIPHALAALGASAADWHAQLPRPVFDERPEYVDFYDKAWELAHAHIDEIPGLPMPRYMDEAHRSDSIWIWDTCFMVHFCKYCPAEFPGIESLENFYRIMMAEGRPKLPVVRGNVWSGDGYWRGSMWLPTAYMAIKALDAYGEYATTRRAARSILAHMYETYRTFEPHTIWECYSPTEPKPAKHGKNFVRPDFCGWSALGPISLFIEDVVGIREANAFENVLVCDFDRAPKGRVGVENYRFGKVVCSVVATAKTVEVETNEPFALVVDGVRRPIPAGRTVLSR